MRKKEINYIYIFSIITAIIVVITAIFRFNDNAYISASVFLMQQLVYMGMIVVWGMALSQRILNRNIKKYLTSATALMLLWLLLRGSRYRIFDGYITIERYLWYLYYIPMIFIPYNFLRVSLEINGNKYKDRIKKICFIISIVLLVMLLTNDLHELAFKFESLSDYNSYKHGIIYFLIAAYIIFLLATGIVLLVKNKKRYRPLIWLLILIIYFVLYLFRPGFLAEFRLINMPEAMCLILLGMMESSIRCGLILTNTNYPEFFRSLSIPAVINDTEERNVYVTSCKIAPDEDNILHSKDLKGGKIYWTENLSDINKLNGILSDISDELAGENELLTAENNLKEDKIRIDEENRLYDEIDAITDKQRKKIKNLLKDLTESSQNFNEKISEACIYNAYIKRRSNLALLSDNNEKMPVSELLLCFKESGDYLNLAGVSFGMNNISEGKFMPSHVMCSTYDFFQELLEENLPELEAVMINVETQEDNIIIRFVLEATGEITAPAGMSYEFEKDDNTSYFTLCIRGCE